MQRLEVSCGVRRIYTSLGAKGLTVQTARHVCVTSIYLVTSKSGSQKAQSQDRQTYIIAGKIEY